MKKTTGSLLKSIAVTGAMVFLLPAVVMALPMNTPVWFSDSVMLNQTISTSGTSFLEYTHTLGSTDYTPNLAAGDVVDIQSNALSMFEMQITPGSVLGYLTISALFDGIDLGSETFTTYSTHHLWTINMTDPLAIDAMEDMEAVVRFAITGGEGSVKLLASTVSGAGIVNPTPEPTSILLLIGSLGVVLAGVKKKTGMI